MGGFNGDRPVKSRNIHNVVIPVKLVLDPDRGTGIQFFQVLSCLWIPAYETVSQSFFVIASDQRERGNLYTFNAL